MSIYQEEDQSLKRVYLDVVDCGQKNQYCDGKIVKIIEKINLNIKFTKNNEIQYIQDDGQIIKTDKYIESLSNPDLMTNLGQINHLQWEGVYSNDLKKVGRWRPIWKGSALSDFGGLRNYTQKMEKSLGNGKNYSKLFQTQVYEVGEYFEDIKTGDWKFIYEENKSEVVYMMTKDQILPLGRFKRLFLGVLFNNIKINSYNQIIYKGEYRKGKKIGLWSNFKNGNNEECEVMYEFVELLSFYCDGGFYNEQGQKNGKWEDLNQDFNQNEKVFYKGEYLNGIKIGKWNIKYREIKGDEYIAGRYYNNKGQKQGLWLDLCTNFQMDSKVYFQGEYNQYGEKIGRWEIIFMDQKIGGGIYDTQSFKVGNWVVLSDRFQDKSQVIYHGQYIKGKRFGRWDISFKDESFEKPERIGGGLFNEYGQKYGKWTEISDKFDDDNQFIFEGYYKNGKKQGLWDLCNNQEWIYIGEGSL